MKILKIENNNGWFWSPEENDWKKIDQIDKDALMKLLELFLSNEVSMDKIESDNLSNQAHLIIYKSIFDKFTGFEENKDKFKDESERTYYDAIQKYSKA